MEKQSNRSVREIITSFAKLFNSNITDTNKARLLFSDLLESLEKHESFKNKVLDLVPIWKDGNFTEQPNLSKIYDNISLLLYKVDEISYPLFGKDKVVKIRITFLSDVTINKSGNTSEPQELFSVVVDGKHPILKSRILQELIKNEMDTNVNETDENFFSITLILPQISGDGEEDQIDIKTYEDYINRLFSIVEKLDKLSPDLLICKREVPLSRDVKAIIREGNAEQKLDFLYFCAIILDYFDIEIALNLYSKYIAEMLKGKTPEEIRQLTSLPNDFTPSEEEKIKKENEMMK